MYFHIIFNFIKSKLMIRLMISMLIMLDAILVLNPILMNASDYQDFYHHDFFRWIASLGIMKLLDIPRFLLGIGLILISLFMINGARVAWVAALFLLSITSFIDLSLVVDSDKTGYFSLFLLILILFCVKFYQRRSLTTAGLIALIGITSLLSYSVLGSIYMGQEFSPYINSVTTAFYFSLVCMTTVGFGDIVPVSDNARMFTISVIFLGITIFTTSVVYIFGVLVSSTRRIVGRRLSYMKNDYIIIGATPIAVMLYRELKKRNLPVLVICDESDQHFYSEGSNVSVGNPVDAKLLNDLNVQYAKNVFIMNNDDAINTFSFLALKELVKDNAEIKIAIVLNQDSNLEKLKLLKPNILFSLSTLGAEVLGKFVCGDPISSTTIGDILLNNTDSNP